MTNKAKLEDLITKSGLKKTFIAESLGISRQAFLNKINNKSLFTSEEIDTLCKMLNVKSLTEKEKIFFAKGVI